MATTLYICYFGVREPLVQTQVIPYLLEIAKDGIGISLLTFEPLVLSEAEAATVRDELAGKGIKWHSLRYHKRFSVAATAYDVFQGVWFIRGLMRREQFDILHARVHIPMLMASVARRLSRQKSKLLFDIRGFFPEEYTDAGIWPANGLLYRTVKKVERWLMKEADGFVVLTEKARDILFPDSAVNHPYNAEKSGNYPGGTAHGSDKLGRPVEVIPCCVDFTRRFKADDFQYRRQIRNKLEIENRYVITHVGALVGLYLAEEIADFLKVAKEIEPRTFALFMTQTDPDVIITLLKKRGFAESDYRVSRLPAADIPKYLVASDLALSFVKAGYATASRSPTKIPEYLACGLPIIANRGVGDVDALISQNNVGVLLDDLTPLAFAKAVREVKQFRDVRGGCIALAKRNFDLVDVGGTRYRRLYQQLLY